MTATAALLRAYAASLNIDLTPQGFTQEVDALPGVYGPPGGELILAKRGDHVLGCIAIKPLEPPSTCEIKRLFVREQARGIGVGRALVEAAIQAAGRLGYHQPDRPVGAIRREFCISRLGAHCYWQASA